MRNLSLDSSILSLLSHLILLLHIEFAVDLLDFLVKCVINKYHGLL